MTNGEETLRAYVTVDNPAQASTNWQYHLRGAGITEIEKALKDAKFEPLSVTQEHQYRQEKRNMAIIKIMNRRGGGAGLLDMEIVSSTPHAYHLINKDFAKAIQALETACFVKFDRFDELNS